MRLAKYIDQYLTLSLRRGVLAAFLVPFITLAKIALQSIDLPYPTANDHKKFMAQISLAMMVSP